MEKSEKKSRSLLVRLIVGIFKFHMFLFCFCNPFKKNEKTVIRFVRMMGMFLLLYTLAAPFVMLANHMTFPEFSENKVHRSFNTASEDVIGVRYVESLLYIYDSAMKPWLPNDLIWPTILLDNKPSFQLGAREAFLDGLFMLKEYNVKNRTSGKKDVDALKAWEKFSYDPDSWIMPRTEDEYAEGAKHLRKVITKLKSGALTFYPRVDNAAEATERYASSLGSINTQLYNCLSHFSKRISEETLGDPVLTEKKARVAADVPWYEIDEVFEYSRGYLFGLRETFVAFSYDFKEPIQERKSEELIASMVDDFLDYTQFEPLVIVSGSPGSMYPKHPMDLLTISSPSLTRMKDLTIMLTAAVR